MFSHRRSRMAKQDPGGRGKGGKRDRGGQRSINSIDDNEGLTMVPPVPSRGQPLLLRLCEQNDVQADTEATVPTTANRVYKPCFKATQGHGYRNNTSPLLSWWSRCAIVFIWFILCNPYRNPVREAFLLS